MEGKESNGNGKKSAQLNSSGASYTTSSVPSSIDTFKSTENILANGKVHLNITNTKPAFQVTHPTSYSETLLHIFKGNIGSGLLAMGDAFKNGGLVFGSVMTIVLGLLCVHAQHLLLNCSDAVHTDYGLHKPPGFAQTVYLVFRAGPQRLRRVAGAMKLLVNAFLCITQLGFCCVYVVFIADNVKVIADYYGFEMDLSIHMIIAVVPILVACMVRNLKYLAPLSTIANVLMAMGIAMIVYEATRDLPSVDSRDFVASFHQMPLYFGTAIYAFEGIGLVLPLKREMRHPELFQHPLGVLNVGMAVVGFVYVLVGFFGYLKWGDNVQGSLTLNMPAGAILSTVVQTAFVVAILFTYPLQLYVAVDITWPVLLKRFGPSNTVAKELGYRALLVLVTFLFAELVPHLSLFISLVGAISSSTLALVFPPVIELVMIWTKPGRIPWYIWFKDSIIILLGVFIFVTGSYESIASIVRVFMK